MTLAVAVESAPLRLQRYDSEPVLRFAGIAALSVMLTRC
jgi:hypothetical protein